MIRTFHWSWMRKSGYPFFAEIPRLKFLESITFHDFGSTRPKIIVIWGYAASSSEGYARSRGLPGSAEVVRRKKTLCLAAFSMNIQSLL